MGGIFFKAWDPEADGATVWSIFPASSVYFDPSPAPFMVNYRVEDLAAYGIFGWVMDPEGNRIELWEPPPGRFPG